MWEASQASVSVGLEAQVPVSALPGNRGVVSEMGGLLSLPSLQVVSATATLSTMNILRSLMIILFPLQVWVRGYSVPAERLFAGRLYPGVD